MKQERANNFHFGNSSNQRRNEEKATTRKIRVVQNYKLYLDYRLVINHLKNMFFDDELEGNSVCACFAHTA